MADGPALFHGVHTENAEAWFKQVEWWLQTKRATDDRARIGHVAGLLRDSARTWFQALNFVAVDSAADTPGLRTFADFKEAFQMRYRRDESNAWRDQAALWSMSQGPNETVEQFIAAVEAKAATARASTEQVKGVVLNGLRQQLRGAVLNHDIQSLEDVRKWGLVAENIAAAEPAATASMAAAFRRLEDSLNEKFEQIQLRALGSDPPAARHQAPPAPPSGRQAHFYPQDYEPPYPNYEPPYYQQGDPDEVPPPRRYQQNRGGYNRGGHNRGGYNRYASPPPPPPSQRYEQQPTMHPARRDWGYNNNGRRAVRGRGEQARHYGAHPSDDVTFDACNYCGGEFHDRVECRARHVRCHTCSLIGHYSRCCNLRGVQGPQGE